MLNSVKELLHSLPVDVDFAGFKSDTLKLAQAGWDLSMRQNLNPYRSGPCLQLAMRHSGAGLYAISHEIHLDYGLVAAGTTDAIAYSRFLASIGFSIMHVGTDIQFRVYPQASSMVASFAAVDPFPQERVVEESIRDFKFFKVANPSIKDIILAPGDVPHVLDMILKAQAPQQKAIRDRERSRDNLEAYRQNCKPAHTVQAQLICLAG